MVENQPSASADTTITESVADPPLKAEELDEGIADVKTWLENCIGCRGRLQAVEDAIKELRAEREATTTLITKLNIDGGESSLLTRLSNLELRNQILETQNEQQARKIEDLETSSFSQSGRVEQLSVDLQQKLDTMQGDFERQIGKKTNKDRYNAEVPPIRLAIENLRAEVTPSLLKLTAALDIETSIAACGVNPSPSMKDTLNQVLIDYARTTDVVDLRKHVEVRLEASKALLVDLSDRLKTLENRIGAELEDFTASTIAPRKRPKITTLSPSGNQSDQCMASSISSFLPASLSNARNVQSKTRGGSQSSADKAPVSKHTRIDTRNAEFRPGIEGPLHSILRHHLAIANDDIGPIHALTTGGSTITLDCIPPNVVEEVKAIRDSYYHTGRVGECLYTRATRSREPVWSHEQGNKRACQMCTNAGRPCLRVIENGLLLLPLLDSLRPGVAVDDDEYWVRTKECTRHFTKNFLWNKPE